MNNADVWGNTTKHCTKVQLNRTITYSQAQNRTHSALVGRMPIAMQALLRIAAKLQLHPIHMHTYINSHIYRQTCCFSCCTKASAWRCCSCSKTFSWRCLSCSVASFRRALFCCTVSNASANCFSSSASSWHLACQAASRSRAAWALSSCSCT